MKENQEIRRYAMQSIRSAQSDVGEKIIEGHAAVFYQRTNIGGAFFEVIEKDAFTECDLSDVALLVNHDSSQIPLSRTKGTLELTVDAVGLAMKAKLDVENNQSARALYSSIARGDLRGMSFCFSVADDEWRDLESTMPLRIIKKISKVFEISVCTSPAYDGTDVQARARDTLKKAKELEKMTFEEFKGFLQKYEASKTGDGVAERTKNINDPNAVVIGRSADFLPGKGFIPATDQRNSDVTMLLSGKNKATVEGAEYRANFLTAFRKNFRSEARSALAESADDLGGYLLPTEFDSEIVSTLEEENILRQISKVITTASTHKIAIVATSPSAGWLSEGEEISLSTEKFGQVTIDAYKLAVGVKISNELLQDSYYNLERHLATEFGRALALAEEDAMLNGDGDKKPKGLLAQLSASASSFITTGGTEITADDLLSLQYSLRRPYRRRAVWLMNDSTVAQIRKLKDSTQNYIWQPSLVEGEPPKLFGQAVYSSQFMPTTAAGKVAVLYGDFKDYFVIGDRGARVIKPLRELFALNNQSAFFMLGRVDCALVVSEAVKGLKMKS